MFIPGFYQHDANQNLDAHSLTRDAPPCRSICPEHLFLARGRKLKLGHLTDAVHFGIQDMCERLGLLDYMAPEVLAVQVRPRGGSRTIITLWEVLRLWILLWAHAF